MQRPRPPRLPKPPPAPRLKTPRPLRLAPARSTGSLELDERRIKGKMVGDRIPFVRWDEFKRKIKFKQGEMITIVGTIGSGKTVLARELVQSLWFVAVLGTKNEDKELYGPFEKRGFEIVDEFDPSPPKDESRVIFRPRLTTPDDAGIRRQRDAFRAMLFEVFEYGGWTLMADELFVLTNRLGLATTFETLWSAGRSLGITIVGATQLPVKIPLMAFDQATHLFLFRNTDKYRIQRMAEFAGTDSTLVRDVIPELPRHEFIYVDTREGTLLRSKVILTDR